MIFIYVFVLITLHCLYFTQSLQSGYTCETSITLECSQLKKLVVLEVIYSSECPSLSEDSNGTSMYPPSRCIAYHRERISTQCNGKQICTIDNSDDKRPSFIADKQANCVFKGKSINIEYSCISDFDSNQLPHIDICSLSTMDGINEGFVHTPNYPLNYPNNMNCVMKIPTPDAGYRLKIYAVDFDIESSTVNRLANVALINDWLEINNNGEKLYGTRMPFTLLYNDVIEASLMFKSDSLNTKRSYNGFLLYFIVTSVRRSRPSTIRTKLTTTPILDVVSESDVTSLIEQKTAELIMTKRQQNNTGLVLLVVLLSVILAVIICAVLLYKRRNDRRIRYFTETFNSFGGNKSAVVTMDSFDKSDETKLYLKHDVSSITIDDNESNLKCTNKPSQNSDHIYSEDPLELKHFPKPSNVNSLDYEYIDYATIKQPINDSNSLI